VIKRIIAMVLPLALIAGMAFAQVKTAPTTEKTAPKKETKKVEKKNPIVEIQTNYGNIYLEVYQKETPIHANNFLDKVKAGKYDSLTFHRVVAGFVIQGGDPSGNGMGSMDGPSLPDEKSPFPEVRGTVAMARSNAASNCQFYINLKDNTSLDQQKFSTFAKVMQGMDVVDKIAGVEVGPNDKPVKPVIMQKLLIVEKLPAAKVAPVKKATPEKK
jgi:peptidyl-prolyl cis-trans isomerase B (cyclophilin B)